MIPFAVTQIDRAVLSQRLRQNHLKGLWMYASMQKFECTEGFDGRAQALVVDQAHDAHVDFLQCPFITHSEIVGLSYWNMRWALGDSRGDRRFDRILQQWQQPWEFSRLSHISGLVHDGLEDLPNLVTTEIVNLPLLTPRRGLSERPWTVTAVSAKVARVIIISCHTRYLELFPRCSAE